MGLTVTDAFYMQLLQQAQFYNLSTMKGRQRSMHRVAGFFRALHKLLPITCTVEVGAHEAGFSRCMRQEHPEYKVFAFEANPHVHAHFLLKGELRQLGIHYEQRAIADKDGHMPFYLYSCIDEQAEPLDGRRQSLLRRLARTENFAAVNVPCSRLDTLFSAPEYSEDRFSLWIDAEGASGLVLQGARAMLQRVASLYLEVESTPKFFGQSTDKEILDFLLDYDFQPVLRDFQFKNQYNIIFVKTALLPLVSDDISLYFQRAMRQNFQRTFDLQPVSQPSGSVKPIAHKPLYIYSIPELHEIMERLPLLRAPRQEFDPKKVVVVCHVDDLEQALTYYEDRCTSMPDFFVQGALEQQLLKQFPSVNIHSCRELHPGMDIQLFFSQAKGPGLSKFAYMAMLLHHKGFQRYCLEDFSTRTLYCRNAKTILRDQDLETIIAFHNKLEDPASRYAYLAVCKGRMEAEPGYIPIAGYPQYFHPEVCAAPGDVICEGGIDNGETTVAFFKAMQKKGTIYAFEPVHENYLQSRQCLQQYAPDICLMEKALWKYDGQLGLDTNTASLSSAFASEAAQGGQCACTCIDKFFAVKGPCHCIKLDVEGAELPVLQGAEQVLRNATPKLMISIYHRRNGHDFLNIPRFLMELDIGYTFYVGHHRPWYNETILYAIAR